MKILEKKEGVAILYCVLFAVIAMMSIALKFSFLAYLTEFIVSVYLLVVLLSKNEKVSRIFSVMFGLFMLYLVLRFGYDVIKVALESNLNWPLDNLLVNIARVTVYLYVGYSLLFCKGKSSKILSFVISGICLVLSVIAIVLSVLDGFLLITFIMSIIRVVMRLLLVRYAYLYNN